MPENIKNRLEQIEEQIPKFIDDKNYQEAVDFAKQARNIALEHFGNDSLEFAQTLYNLAALYYRLGYAQKAEPLLLQALKIRKKRLNEEHEDIFVSCKGLGQVYDSLEDYKNATIYFEECLKINYSDDQVLQGLVNIYRNSKKYEKAENIVKQAIEIEGENSTRLDLLYVLYLDQEKYKELEGSLLRSLDKDPTQISIYEGLSFVYSMLEDDDKQQEILLDAINRNLTSFDIYCDLGELLEKKGKHNDACQVLSKAKEIIPPNDTYSWSQLGEIYIELKKFDEAIELLEEGNEKLEGDFSIKKQLIFAYLYNGDCKNAEITLSSLIDLLGPKNKISTTEFEQCLLSFGKVASNSCPDALTFLEEAYFDLPDVDDTEWVFSSSRINLTPKWVDRYFSLIFSLKRKLYLNKIADILQLPLRFLPFVIIFFIIANFFFNSELKYFKIIGTVSTIAWSFCLSLALATFITAIITGGIEKEETLKISHKLRRIIAYVIAYILLFWLSGKFKHSTNEMYQLTGKIMYSIAYIYPIFSIITDILAWSSPSIITKISAWFLDNGKDTNQPQEVTSNCESNIYPDLKETDEKKKLTNLSGIQKPALIGKVICYGLLILFMIFFGALTTVKAIISSSLSEHFSFNMAVVQIIQGITLPITIYIITFKIFHAWRVTKNYRYRIIEILNSLCYSIIIAYVSSHAYLLLNEEPLPFTPLFLMLLISLLATILGGMFMGGIGTMITNRSKQKILLPLIFLLTAPFIFLLFIVLPAHVVLFTFGYNYSFTLLKELFLLQIIIGGWLTAGFFGLKGRAQHERQKLIPVRISDPRLKPAYELADRMLKNLDHKPTLKEHYVTLELAIQLYYPGDCLFLPPIFPFFVLSPMDQFILTFKDSFEKEPYSWLLNILSLQKSSNIEEMPSLLEKIYQLEKKIRLYNREELVDKMKHYKLPYADTVAFQSIYENGDYLLREGRVVEAAELAASGMSNTISQETKIEFMLSSYRLSQIAGRYDISARILDEIRSNKLITKDKYSINDINYLDELWLKFLSKFQLWFSLLQPMTPQPAKFTEGILCGLEADYLIKSSKRARLHKEYAKKQGVLNNARQKLDHAWQKKLNKLNRAAMTKLCQSELSYFLELMEAADYQNKNDIPILKEGLFYWYFYVLLGPVSNILLSQRADGLELRKKNIKIYFESNTPNESLQREFTGGRLLEWIEQDKWDQILIKNYDLENAEYDGWQENISGLLPYPMDASSCIASHLIDLARLLYNTGKNEKALNVLQYTSFVKRYNLDPAIRRDLSTLSGKINLRLGKSNDALSDLKTALDESLLVARDLRSEEQIIDFNAENANIYNLLIEEYFKRKEFEKCLTLLERGRSESLSIMMRQKTNNFDDTVGEKDEDWIKLEKIRSKIFEIQTRYSIVKEQSQRDMVFVEKEHGENYKSSENSLTHTEKIMDKLDHDLDSLDREYRLMMEKLINKQSTDIDYLQPPPNFGKLCNDLEDDEAFLIFHESEDCSFCFWATNKEIFGHEISDKAKFLANSLVNNLRNPQTPIETIDQLANELSGLSLSPLLDITYRISKRRVYYVPMGIWGELPIIILKDQIDGLQDEEWRIATLPSASIRNYLQKVEPISAASAALGIGNPYLGLHEFDLPFAGQEVEAIRKQFPNSQVLSGHEATIDAYLYALYERPSIIHFACHGEFKSEQPMLSALHLSPSDRDDGVLNGYRIRYHGLGGNVDLCVLSACWSGRASVAGFNEQIGLSRILLGAGASSLITSLWAIEDQSTAILFEKFYEFACEFGPAEALEMARDYLRNIRDYKHPYYWAPFVWTGSL